MFSKKLLNWHKKSNTRTMPWKGIKDPYKIWLSEIILQQTRVDQGLQYYLNFTQRYPTIYDLALATDDEVFKLWQGLGYYNRCKNLLFTARYIVSDLEGNFPRTFEEIVNLKGIGTYTAAAIASFAFGESKAVVDGNVVRVLSRHFGLEIDFYTSKGKAYFINYANSLISKKEPALFNQAIMDLGAIICKPVNPECEICPLQKSCFAYGNDKINTFPLKKKALVLKKRYLHFLVFEDKNHLLLQQRSDNDIWANLYDFFSIESETVSHFENNELINPQRFVQKLSHQHIEASFYILPQKNLSKIAKHLNLFKVKKAELIRYSFPRVIVSFLEKNKYL